MITFFKKKIPCTIVPNQVFTISGQKYCKVLFDESKYIDLTKEEVARYCSDTVRIFDIYPANNGQEIAYADACIPNKVTDNFYYKELSRLLKIIEMITNTENVKSSVFYQLADFISYEILFKYCTHTDRMFMLNISNNLLSDANVPVPEISKYIVTMTKTIFDNYPKDNTIVYYIQNYNNLIEFAYLTFPLPINIPILKQNVNLLHEVIVLPFSF